LLPSLSDVYRFPPEKELTVSVLAEDGIDLGLVTVKGTVFVGYPLLMGSPAFEFQDDRDEYALPGLTLALGFENLDAIVVFHGFLRPIL
jgi:hypothetical protein